MSVKVNKTVYINYTGYLAILNLPTSSQKHKSLPKLIYTLTKSSVHCLITCYNLQVNLQRFDSRGVLNIQYRPTYFSIIPIPKLSLACTVKHYIRAPVTSATLHDWNQNSRRFKSCSSHPMRLNNQIQTRLNASYTKNNAATRNDVFPKRGVFLIVPKEHSLHSDLSSRSPFTSSHNCQFFIFSVTHLFTYCTYFSHDDDDRP